MNKLLLLILLGIGLISCGREYKREYRFDNDGLIYKSGTEELFTGKIIDTADVIIEYEVVNGKKNGEFVTFYTNGNIEKTGWIKQNANVGEWKYYYPDGTLESRGHFVKDTPHGLWERFYRNGKLKQSGLYKYGLEDGEWLFYDEKGELIKFSYYHEGKIKNSQINLI